MIYDIYIYVCVCVCIYVCIVYIEERYWTSIISCDYPLVQITVSAITAIDKHVMNQHYVTYNILQFFIAALCLKHNNCRNSNYALILILLKSSIISSIIKSILFLICYSFNASIHTCTNLSHLSVYIVSNAHRVKYEVDITKFITDIICHIIDEF